MRKKIIHNHEDTIGTVHAFDGSILYVPKQLRGAVRELVQTVRPPCSLKQDGKSLRV